MWDEDDIEGRIIQGICAVFLALFALADGWVVFVHFGFFFGVAGITLFIGSVRLCWRCFWYAVTGKNNVNRDNY
jgi:hypothetical protein